MKKGFKAELLDEIVNVITSRRKVWIDTMMREELGLIEEEKKPLDGAITTFTAFNLVGLVPLFHSYFSIFRVLPFQQNMYFYSL
jgi:hypothetical protein